jgi:hypothetical protein
MVINDWLVTGMLLKICHIFFQLVGGDWNHGFLNDFPETVGNGISSQLTKSIIFQRGRAQPPTR